MSWCLQNSKRVWLESVLIYWDLYEWFGRAFLRSQRQRSQRVELVSWPLQMKQMVSNETFLDSDIYKIHLIFWMSLLKFEYLWCSVNNRAGGKKHQGGDVESWATFWLCPSGDTNWKFQWVPVCHTEPFVLLVRENLSESERDLLWCIVYMLWNVLLFLICLQGVWRYCSVGSERDLWKCPTEKHSFMNVIYLLYSKTIFKASPVHSELIRSTHFNQPANKLPKKLRFWNWNPNWTIARYWDIVAVFLKD